MRLRYLTLCAGLPAPPSPGAVHVAAVPSALSMVRVGTDILLPPAASVLRALVLDGELRGEVVVVTEE